MATIAERARQDLQSKIANEKKLSPKLKAIFRQMGRDLKLKYATSQQLIDASVYEPEFKAVLIQRSRMVANEFKRSFRRNEAKDDTDDQIDAELLAWLIIFIDEQIGYITATTDEQMRQLVADVMRDLSNEGIPATKEAVAQKVSERFIRQGMARSELISSEVVNTVAEKSKFVEAGVLARAADIKGTKTWFTNMDGKERDSHHNAFGQTREISKPFNVGSSLLMFPKDRSLGAQSKEIFNCRCSAIYE